MLRLFMRAGCHLCEDMESDLRSIFGSDCYRLERIDISKSPALSTAFGLAIPVLLGGEVELCRHFLDPMPVRAYLGGIR